MTIKNSLLAIVLGFFISPSSYATDETTVVKLLRKGGVVSRILSVEKNSTLKRAQSAQKLQSIPLSVPEDTAPSKEFYEEWIYPSRELPESFKNSAVKLLQEDAGSFYESEIVSAQKELRTLIDQGPPANRICLTIVGDGYTQAEKEKFFTDAKRITNELFVGQTFASYLPLFNVYAVFIPSNESGLTDGKKKDTALGLFRSPAGSKRGIMPGNVSVIESTLKMAPKTDFPILIANDDYYGGLGGRYAITTRSEKSGIVVLRHELGHNFGVVGEEYDGGYAYFGANTSGDIQVAWEPWLTEKQGTEQSGQYLLGGYLWANLSAGKQILDFEFPAPASGNSYTYAIELSTVGWDTSGDVRVKLDGQEVKVIGEFTNDRGFLKIQSQATLAPGKHRLEFEELIPDGDNVLGFAQVFAYPENYRFQASTVSAYRTYDSEMNFAGYRPTHDQCLMRDMLKTGFCSVDKENMWIRFLKRVQLIDAVAVKAHEDGTKTVSIQTPKLVGLHVRWFKSMGGSYSELVDRKNQTQWTAAANAGGDYQVKVEFPTTEVRSPTADFATMEAFSL